ncbi:MAG: hypothetical protein AAF682_10580 [Planctomycetota bacterium]
MEIRIDHSLAEDEVARRIANLSEKYEIEHASEDETGRVGSLKKSTGFGEVEAGYRIEAAALVIDVRSKPAFLPEAMIRRALEDNLREGLTG